MMAGGHACLAESHWEVTHSIDKLLGGDHNAGMNAPSEIRGRARQADPLASRKHVSPMPHWRLATAAATTTLLVAIGCSAESGTGSLAQEPIVSPTPMVARIETLPPDWIVNPDLYDQDGCLKPPPDSTVRVCPPPPAPFTSLDPNDPGPVAGYQGPVGDAAGGYVRVLKAGRPIVLVNSLTTSQTGPWRAVGLVRNEGGGTIGRATVRAVLHGAHGAPLETVTGPTLLDSIREGEPAPFILEAASDASLVEHVDWSVEAGDLDPAPLVRVFAVGIDWSVPYGNRDRVDLDLPGWPVDPPAPPYPFLMTGTVTSYARTPVRDAHVVVAFADPTSRILFAGAATMLPVAEPIGWQGSQGYVLRVEDPKVGPLLQSSGEGGRLPTATTYLWAWGQGQ